MMRFIGNVFWFILGGALMGLGWWLAGLIAYLSIICIPWGKACFTIGQFAFFPFGKEAVNRRYINNKDDIGTGIIADKMSKVPVVVTDAIRNGKIIPDLKLQALSKFSLAMIETRGRPDQIDVAEFLAAGYSEQHVLDILLAISVKTLSNYANHLFNTPLDDMFKSREWHLD